MGGRGPNRKPEVLPAEFGGLWRDDERGGTIADAAIGEGKGVGADMGDSFMNEGGSTLKVGVSSDFGDDNVDLNTGRATVVVEDESATVSLFDLFMGLRLPGVDGSRRAKEESVSGSDNSVNIPLNADAHPASSF